jgi:hypothetical protein
VVIRNLLAITAGCAFGIGVGFLIFQLGNLAAGVWIAVAAGLMIAVELINAIRKDRDKRRQGRDAVWQRRIAGGLAGARPALPNERKR